MHLIATATTKVQACDRALLLALFMLVLFMPAAHAEIRTYYDQQPVQQAQKPVYEQGASLLNQGAVGKRVQELMEQRGMAKPKEAPPLLGRALVFIEFDRITPAIYKAIKRMNDIQGLEVLVMFKYATTKRHLEYFTEQGMDDLYFKLVDEVSTKADNRNKVAARFGVSSYRTIVYQSPYGDKQIFRLTPLDPFLKKINKIKRQQRR